MEICKYDQCTGCGACKTTCPVQCIDMIKDKEGFYIPEIDKEKCIYCRKCQKICPSNNKHEYNLKLEKVWTYAFIHPDVGVLRKSASGGAFTVFADYVLSFGGKVFGAAYDNNFHVTQRVANNVQELNVLRDSKYVESNTMDTFLQVKQLLENDKIVLYTGTPCQIAGLYASLQGKQYDNLYTIDILCHGVPSDKLFSEYINSIKSGYGEIVGYSFRDKSRWGWGSWGSFTYINKKNNKKKKKYFIAATDYYYALFFKECTLRESCYQCNYAKIPRIADITIGDCWGIDELITDFDNKDGVSLILVNNEHGNDLMKKIPINREKDLIALPIDDVIKHNKTIVSATHRPEERDTFYKDFNEYGFDKASKMYCKLKKTEMISLYVPRKLKQKIKKVLRRIKK